MKPSITSIHRRGLCFGALTTALGLFSAREATAWPYGQTRRVARRTSRRVTRRHMYALPIGYATYRWGAYNYYRVGGLFYYPYMYQGRTVYVEINIDGSGHPLPPPPASEIDIDINIPR
jgi:hypothetical protein